MFGIEFSTLYGYAVLRKSVRNHGQNDLWDLYLDGKLIQEGYRWAMPDLNDLSQIMQMKYSLETFLDSTVGAPKLNLTTNEVEMGVTHPEVCKSGVLYKNLATFKANKAVGELLTPSDMQVMADMLDDNMADIEWMDERFP